jgi:ribosome-associated toxin RatA of RatAB toxin-antitoxin module
VLLLLSLSACSNARPAVVPDPGVVTPDPMSPAATAPAPAAEPPPAEAPRPASEAPLEVERDLIIHAPIEVVYAVLDDPKAYWTILPWVRDAKGLGRSPEGDLLITMVHGMPLINADYTMRVRKGEGHTARMWIDREFPHSIAEAHGEATFTEAPDHTTRVQFHMSADLGRGSLLWMFSPRIRSEMGKIPSLLRKHAEGLVAQPPEPDIRPVPQPAPP